MLRRYVYIKFISLANNILQRTGLKETEIMANIKFFTFLLCIILCANFFCKLATGEVYPYPGDCSKYQHCDNSGCFILSCGAGTEFNPNIGTCDYPLANRGDCSNRY